LLSNAAMAGLFERTLRTLGRATRPRDELSGAWSGDTGNVSWFVPTIQPQMAMTARDVPPHSHEFHAASIGPAAERCILDSAKAMAMTAIDLIVDPVLLEAVKSEFAEASGVREHSGHARRGPEGLERRKNDTSTRSNSSLPRCTRS
jgi:hypothetical protein